MKSNVVRQEDVQDDDLAAFRAAISHDLKELAALHDVEPDAELLALLRGSGFPGSLRLKLESKPASEGLRLMERYLTDLPDDPGAAILDELAVDYADIYLTLALRASPSESVWLDEENLERQQPMFQVREYYRRHGLAAADWRKRADDHLVLQLQFLAYLLDPEGSEDGREPLREAAQFMDEHLLRWVGSFCARVAARCATPYFAGLALMTGAYCEELRDVLAQVLDEPRPSPDEIEQRMSPKGQTEEIPLQYVPGVGPAV